MLPCCTLRISSRICLRSANWNEIWVALSREMKSYMLMMGIHSLIPFFLASQKNVANLFFSHLSGQFFRYQHPNTRSWIFPAFPIASMYGIFTYIYHKNHLNVCYIYHTWMLWETFPPNGPTLLFFLWLRFSGSEALRLLGAKTNVLLSCFMDS